MFPDRLKELRKEKGITQAQLAENIFISRSLIAKYETGASHPSREILEKLALYFNVEISDLVNYDETALIVIENQRVAEKMNRICLYIVSIFSFSLAILLFIPFCKGIRYVYPLGPDQTIPVKETFFASLFTGTYNYGNPIGLFSFLLCIFNSIIAILCLVYRQKKYQPYLNVVAYALFVINLFLWIATLFCCLSYIT